MGKLFLHFAHDANRACSFMGMSTMTVLFLELK